MVVDQAGREGGRQQRKVNDGGDLQGLDPPVGDIKGSNDDKIGIDAELVKRSEHNTCCHVELIVSRSTHIHHGRVSISVFCSEVRRSFRRRSRFSVPNHISHHQNHKYVPRHRRRYPPFIFPLHLDIHKHFPPKMSSYQTQFKK